MAIEKYELSLFVSPASILECIRESRAASWHQSREGGKSILRVGAGCGRRASEEDCSAIHSCRHIWNKPRNLFFQVFEKFLVDKCFCINTIQEIQVVPARIWDFIRLDKVRKLSSEPSHILKNLQGEKC